MICTHPFSLWPLHVKLFTEEAVRHWAKFDKESGVQTVSFEGCSEELKRNLRLLVADGNGSGKGKGKAKAVADGSSGDETAVVGQRFPPGFVCTIELEGVDGRSGHPLGSGRIGPVDDTDEAFKARILAKNTTLIASGKVPSCAICTKPVDTYAKEPFTAALCPHGSCKSVSHIECLSSSFLAASSQSSSSNTYSSTLLPRGGNCPSCGAYTLWGDIIRACDRRSTGTVDGHNIPEDEDDLYTEDEEVHLEVEEGSIDEGLLGMMNGLTLGATSSPTKRRGRPPKAAKSPSASPKRRVRPPKASPSPSPSPKRRGRPPKVAASVPAPVATPPKRRGRPPKTVSALQPKAASGEEFDFSGVSGSTSGSSEAGNVRPSPQKRRGPGRPPGSLNKKKTRSKEGTGDKVTSPRAKVTKASANTRNGKAAVLDSNSDSDSASYGTAMEDFLSQQRKPGRPRSRPPASSTSSLPSTSSLMTPSPTKRRGRPPRTPPPSSRGYSKESGILISSDSDSDSSPSFDLPDLGNLLASLNLRTPSRNAAATGGSAPVSPVSILGSHYRVTPQHLRIGAVVFDVDQEREVIDISD
ncbi:hypothetical protein CC1G_02061 [Coprinopsis cinerea okayama7|uniref:Structure-specific endonuclease subunit SLX1 C-terminal domain-containing protein n=1 Tax=Coprinopsis cinerea (strain Okayama-7 / 130 / ATCC MYA-4618 / FGSC 9003) TaxID=240176 RepID=A8N6F8_COPC7|nr:hypothetical protein CC1G_02061 [Coprinopsis cinerea okayama7\|eukprot:XP_001830425.1 hypothetical protein CC1G_02061 [Coprinopsis cinerea okayama7\